MNNASAILRSLLIYGICVPLAIWLGFLLTNPLNYSSLGVFGVVAAILVLPLLLKWHYPLLLLSLNLPLTVFFLPGRPSISLVMIAISLGISIFERTLNKERNFISVPQLTWPLICLAIVAIGTAKLTGGFGLRAFGSDVYGGKKYIYLLAAIAGYFALTARRIPVEQAKLYATLFFVGGVAYFIGDLYLITPSSLYFIFWFFPPSVPNEVFEIGTTRLGGIGVAAAAMLSVLIIQYGIKGIFFSPKLWRPIAFVIFLLMSFLGGFRSTILAIALMLSFQFFLERLHRTKLVTLFAFFAILGMVLLVPIAPRLPFTFQRALAFLPFLDLDPVARLSAEESSEWRIKMWEALLPQIPQHLLLGKGYAISMGDFQVMGRDVAFKSIDASQQGLALAGDYHNGPISVILPFGIWGVIVVVWFFVSYLRVLYNNYRYGDPALRLINTSLLALSLARILMFVFVVGDLAVGLLSFIGIIGLSVAINGGVCSPTSQPAEEKTERRVMRFRRPQFQPAFQRLKD